MSETPETRLPEGPTTLYQHALRMHRQTPDRPHPGSTIPWRHWQRRRRGTERQQPVESVTDGAGGTDSIDAARVLDAYFDDTAATPRELAERLGAVPGSTCYEDNVGDAARRAPAARAREAGRWLVRHGTETGPVAVGLALLAEAGTVEDIPRIQTIGLISNDFGSLAVEALDRLPGGIEPLLWLARRVTAWGRVEAVHSLCRQVDQHPAIRPWLLRRAADGDFLNSYFATHVAEVTGLHEVIADYGDDAEVVDHTGQILVVMTYCEGMGTSLRNYPHALALLEAHARHIGHLGPSIDRYFVAAHVAHYLTREIPAWSDDAMVKARWDGARRAYLSLIDRADWCETARAGVAAGIWRATVLADSVAPELGLRAYRDAGPVT
ncbi:hypothetical protein ACFV0B_24650 [Streptomyces xanthophaeus]|uniref:hypothetical protein n=1 Tax=Streptomyces xanthophaeus TaxID=67385 RepID=UPI0036B0BBCE